MTRAVHPQLTLVNLPSAYENILQPILCCDEMLNGLKYNLICQKQMIGIAALQNFTLSLCMLHTLQKNHFRNGLLNMANVSAVDLKWQYSVMSVADDCSKCSQRWLTENDSGWSQETYTSILLPTIAHSLLSRILSVNSIHLLKFKFSEETSDKFHSSFF